MFRTKTVLFISYICIYFYNLSFWYIYFYPFQFYLHLFFFYPNLPPFIHPIISTVKTFNLYFSLVKPSMTWEVSCWVILLLKLNFTRLVLKTSIQLWHPGRDVWSTDLFALVNRRMRQLYTACKTCGHNLHNERKKLTLAKIWKTWPREK